MFYLQFEFSSLQDECEPLKREQLIKEIIASGSDSDEENEYNLPFCKSRKKNPSRILSTSESEETEEPEIRIYTPSGIKWTSKKHSPNIHDFTPQHSGVVGNNLNRSSRILDYFRLLFLKI
ncbi:hypothetical protein AVEN_180717-1 [Araneus ventricosus]|uniref:Uncharacterized protein n=1 Tax=Araneus ventricosus TaxID=182803 RepID=A0A4Y2FZL2_ARAVE|nr:hypothetical protein AVEN_180717-1 [Araneus ventricosus]